MSRLKVTGAVVAAFALGVTVAPATSYAVSYFSTTRTVTGYTTATCPVGYRVTGGGAEAPADIVTSTSARTYKIRYSRPTVNGWTARLDVTVQSLGSSPLAFSQSVKVYAVCVH